MAGGSRSRTQKYSFQSDRSYCPDISPGSIPKTAKEKIINQCEPSTPITQISRRATSPECGTPTATNYKHRHSNIG